MKAKHVAIMTITCCILTVDDAWSQGALIPMGAPSPTMKTLEQIDAAITEVSNAVEQVEVRTDLATVAGDGIYHHVISQPGSYYLSGNIGVTKHCGININAADVTLDLSGFNISRASGSGGYGININGISRVSVRNGTVVGFQYGIRFDTPPYSRDCLLEKLVVSGCDTYGIYAAGYSSRIVDCRAHDNLGGGISGGKRANISGCIAYFNGGNGISASEGSSLSACVAHDNGGDGIRVSLGECMVSGNTCNGNGRSLGDGAGIFVSSGYGTRIEGNNVTNNDRGIEVNSSGNFIARNTARGNSTNWVVASNNVCLVVSGAGCTVISGDSGGTAPGSTDPNANFTY